MLNIEQKSSFNILRFVLFTSRRQTSTSYFPYKMYNAKKNTDLSGRPIQKKYGFRLYNTGKIMYGHMSYMGVFDWIKIIAVQ